MGAYEIDDQLLTAEDKKALTANKEQQMISRKKEVFQKLISNPIAIIGGVTLLLIVIFSLIGESLTPYSANEQIKEATNLQPSSEHWFGTDDLGRDIWARTWAGGKISLAVGLIAAALDIGLGVLIGGFSGYVRGRNRLGTLIDEWIVRGIEVMYGIPYLLIVILLLIVMKPGLFTIILSLALTGWIGMARLVRAQVLSLKQKEFVIAAERLGTSHMKIIYKHLIPNLTGIIIVNLSFTIPAAIFSESFLSFIGLGVQSPAASWGTMTNDALGTLLSGEWWQLFFPAIMIALIMFAFNAIGDGLQDAIDPKIVKQNRKGKKHGAALIFRKRNVSR
ncbi:ABC transporter permease [Bacillus cytotoxicus]|uniref:Binding-protein-dependent transport systems inner membrane component n=1 Tax=Bacillus cytotoxicus (strain DSM 22905 / CIP 110041 / 391-98 / NVH 391-98) TaxID=315749 RepID=A7GK97_BACCN|nr:ABC transporter permease [Bacillus cytotoxicus]ABS20555.1 binding-protein-dependent transport systems inner membrane component [Bacillus cytotoxicus NVH 391-98]AWC43302.1 ABC transporter permease [Bacillus cytotoxicus]MDH2865620.1 ABC transporter permease [Bacillus cytotoxicus]MDH2885635.1 ABC transporter permease [Bacillus cytotoxicus]NZD34507.1 ABC transporter permease [Bacillus cytotoxicus]